MKRTFSRLQQSLLREEVLSFMLKNAKARHFL